MERVRGHFQGVRNILRFNWPFYALAALLVTTLTAISLFSGTQYAFLLHCLSFMVAAATAGTLLVSCYVYDLSPLYAFNWYEEQTGCAGGTIVNIHAGFGETSPLLQAKYRGSELRVFDFYDPEKHTEVSIRRARKAATPFPGTQTVRTTALPLEQASANRVFLILSAHEIRNEQERILFFKEVNRVVKPSGKIIVTEHLRDLPNFLAYNIGFFISCRKPPGSIPFLQQT